MALAYGIARLPASLYNAIRVNLRYALKGFETLILNWKTRERSPDGFKQCVAKLLQNSRTRLIKDLSKDTQYFRQFTNNNIYVFFHLKSTVKTIIIKKFCLINPC